jgi:hypothetical protein
MRLHRAAVGAAAALALVLSAPATAGAGGSDITTVAGGLDGPRQLSDYKDGKLVVAESDVGEVSSVDLRTGQVRTLLSNLGNAQGVDYEKDRLYVAIGEAMGPPEGEPQAASAPAAPYSQVVLEATTHGRIIRSWDLLKYELKHNPDRQTQFVDGQPVDTLSNPFSVLAQHHRLLVSDAGANAVLAIDLRSGRISTFFVPPVVRDTPECRNAENNPGTVGCDPVPTEIAQGPNGLIYVGTLSAEAPGAARVYVLDHKGKVVKVIKHLTSVTGVAVAKDGTVVVSNVLEGLPQGEPGPDFDPTTVGQLTKIGPDGRRWTAEVTMPTGLEIKDGKLYASTFSLFGLFLGVPEAGQVQRVDHGAFTRMPR